MECLMTDSNLAILLTWRRFGGRRLIFASGSFVRMKYDRANGALDALYLHDPVLKNVPELLDIRGRDEGHYVELAGYFVELFQVLKLRESLHDIVHYGRIDEYVHEGEKT